MGSIFSRLTSSSQPPVSKVILVTGASAGIGKECSLSLIKRGHVVYGAARRVDQMQDIVAAGGHALQMDITNEKDIIQAIEHILKEQGRIDVLVNNAGYGEYGPIEDVSIDAARRQFDVNIFGLARITKEVIPHMRRAGKGTIINMSSMGGKVYAPYFGWYQASKHALEGWSDCLRLELNPFNIKVAIIEPGVIRTDFTDVALPPMIERSKGGPYEKSVAKFVQTWTEMEQGGSPVSVIADVVVKASESSNPQRRYVAGKIAKELIFVRSWFGDAVMDFLSKLSFM